MLYTAPFHGFQDAADYYQRASAMRVIDKISIPTLIITAADDPFVPPGPFTDPVIARNRNITLSSRRTAVIAGSSRNHVPGDHGYWAEREIVRFLTSHCRLT